MSDLILNSENGNADLVVKRYHVALVYVRSVKAGEENEDGIEIRHQMIEIQATDEGAAEWLGKRYSEEDAQMPEGFVHNSSIAAEIK